jgi:hypothetical protein
MSKFAKQERAAETWLDDDKIRDHVQQENQQRQKSAAPNETSKASFATVRFNPRAWCGKQPATPHIRYVYQQSERVNQHWTGGIREEEDYSRTEYRQQSRCDHAPQAASKSIHPVRVEVSHPRPDQRKSRCLTASGARVGQTQSIQARAARPATPQADSRRLRNSRRRIRRRRKCGHRRGEAAPDRSIIPCHSLPISPLTST